VACNLAQRAQRAPARAGNDARILLASEKEVRIVGSEVELPPESVALLMARDSGQKYSRV
jgi:hypothetical protein